jgi:hypothetical protein
MLKKYGLYSKLFNLFQLDSYFRHAALAIFVGALQRPHYFDSAK